MKTIAFLGMGAMGSRMVLHIIKHGHKVIVWNRNLDKCDESVKAGATLAVTPAEAAAKADIVISMVRDDDASKQVWLTPDTGALATLPSGAIAIESSTLTPNWVHQLAEQCRARDIELADAPVTGSRPQAEEAALIYFVGASDNTFAQIKPILSMMGNSIHHAGSSGAGANIKLAVNALFGTQLASLAELLGMLNKAGISPQQGMEIISSTPICSPIAKMAGTAMVNGQFAASFPIELVEKDFNYVNTTAQALKADTPLSKTAHDIFLRAVSKHLGEDNITGIAQLYLENTE